MCRWEAALKEKLRVVFERIAHRRFSQMMNKARKGKKRPYWIPEDVYPQLLDAWKKPEYKLKCDQASKNRKQGARLTHPHGSKSARTLRKEFESKHGKAPDAVTAFELAKTKGGQILPEYVEPAQQLGERHTERFGTDREQWPCDPTPGLWIDPRKGRLPGAGSVPPQVYGFPGPRRRTTGIHIGPPQATPAELEQRRRLAADHAAMMSFLQAMPGFSAHLERERAAFEAQYGAGRDGAEAGGFENRHPGLGDGAEARETIQPAVGEESRAAEAPARGVRIEGGEFNIGDYLNDNPDAQDDTPGLGDD